MYDTLSLTNSAVLSADMHKTAYKNKKPTHLMILISLKKKLRGELYRQRPQLVGEVSVNFCGQGCHVVSVTDPYGRILGFLDWNRYFSFK
jgi:hypothetical protein